MTTSTDEWRESVPPDVVLSAVANGHRRAILRSLNHTDEQAMEVSALVDQVTEHVRAGEPPDDEHRQRVHIALHHIHLPKLEEAGIIEYDSRAKTVHYHGHSILDKWHDSISENGLKLGE